MVTAKWEAKKFSDFSSKVVLLQFAGFAHIMCWYTSLWRDPNRWSIHLIKLGNNNSARCWMVAEHYSSADDQPFFSNVKLTYSLLLTFLFLWPGFKRRHSITTCEVSSLCLCLQVQLRLAEGFLNFTFPRDSWISLFAFSIAGRISNTKMLPFWNWRDRFPSVLRIDFIREEMAKNLKSLSFLRIPVSFAFNFW